MFFTKYTNPIFKYLDSLTDFKKSVKESKYLIGISVCLVILDLCPKICQNEKLYTFSNFPFPERKKEQTNKQTNNNNNKQKQKQTNKQNKNTNKTR